MHKGKIVFLTSLTLWSMGKGHGGPAFTQTVQKYIDEGWEVFLISDVPGNQAYPNLDSEHNIFIQPSRFFKFCKIRKIGLFFRYLDQWTRTWRFIRAGKLLLEKNSKNTVLYAYEVFGVTACRKLASLFSLAMVTRFQGTKLSYVRNTALNRIRNYPGFQALSTPADLIIMTNDGTFGDRTLRKLHNTSPTLHLRNGLEPLYLNHFRETTAFDRQKFRLSLGIEAAEPMFLTISRLVNWKRLDRSIDGFADYCQTHPKGTLIIVGDGEERQALERRVESLGIGKRVVFTGSVSHSDTYQYMLACDIFLSLYDLSNLGNPLLEAMALGKCIVTLDVGDTRSVIQDRENAILLTMETLSSLSSILSELAVDTELRQQLGANAAAYAQSHFQTWESRMNAEFQAVSALLDQKH